MRITYTLNGQFLWDVEEDSLIDRVLKDIERRAREKNTRVLMQSWSTPQYMLLSLERNQHKDVLYDARRA